MADRKLHHVGGLSALNPEELTSHERALVAALDCFVERGYHGTTIRQIANRAGVSVPGLYHHFASKLALLERLIDDTMDDLVATTADALAQAGSEPAEQFVAVVDAHVRFHCQRPGECFIGNTELRSLSAAGLRRTIRKRDRQQQMFEAAVGAGLGAGAFAARDPKLAALAVITMCTGVASWYRESGPLDVDEIVATYRELSLNAVGYARGLHHAAIGEHEVGYPDA